MDRKPAQSTSLWISAVFAIMTVCLANPQATAVEAHLESLPEGATKSDDAFQVTIEISEIVDGKPVPVDRHLILFKDQRAYDFSLVQPMDITVVDWATSQMTVLSRQKNLQSSMPMKKVNESVAQLRVYAKKNQLEDQLGINAQPLRNDDQSTELTFGDYHYNVKSVAAPSPSQAARFAQFTNAVARLNLARHRGAPPFARMSLGNELAAHGQLPQTMHLTIESDGNTRMLVSQYAIKESLSPEAEDRINKVSSMLMLYRDVPMSDVR
ncbi:hypothetical protein [Rhodopirellula sp. MGV]|uniref:hypothetical protein n=1 Tax=Rhodopirellula sp. MGV TaxID=2023130 RepID=UPI000B96B0B9|nr:hypothetical protein [Rhodopirellula sp. MGV]OYP38205.1 hypothetical protein CGZ80_03010 [Rhodopirellula sp. MGV]PNY38541.1 hypothetical protein C2E31_01050 [Rhodopirellula baltica]